MIRSMTGFGHAAADVDGAHYAVEVRSLNNRYFKAQVRLPEALQALEAEISAALSHRLVRGSVVATVHFADVTAAAAGTINTAALRRYLDQLLAVEGVAHTAARVDLGAMLHLPGVVSAEPAEDMLDRARPVLLRLVDEACDALVVMRTREGQILYDELVKHCREIEAHLTVVADRAPDVVQQFAQRLRDRMTTLLAEVGASTRDEDIIREVAVFAERSDIAEELARLQGHIRQFQEIIDADADTPAGRTLDFLSQEMLREANTIGSKSMDVEIARRIVEVKGAIDRLKEQAANVE